ncbi:MAG: pilin [bacterium]|nr:pilin [bacterium]
MRKVFTGIVICIVAVFFIFPFSADAVFVKEISYTLEQPLGGQQTIRSAAQYIQLVYAYALGIVGIMAVVMIMFGGMRWISAAGNEQTISAAKEIITSAVIGLLIALFSYTILVFINPSFINLGFAVERIQVTADVNMLQYEKCSVAPFVDTTCENEAGDNVDCSTIPCTEIGVSDDSGEVCRGDVCAEGTGGCYIDAMLPTQTVQCTHTKCGEQIDKCKSLIAGDDPGNEYYNCLCSYYPKLWKTAFGFDIAQWNTSYVDSSYNQQKGRMQLMCEEANDQSYWEAAVVFFKDDYHFTGGESSAPLYGWDCGFNCALGSSESNTTSETVYNWTIGWVVGDAYEPTVTFDCKSTYNN